MVNWLIHPSGNFIVLLLYLAGALLVDIFVRWLAFERVESYGIDIAIFSTVFSGIEMLRAEPAKCKVWQAKFFLGLVLLLSLTVLHRNLVRQLKEKIGSVFEDLYKNVTTPEKRTFLKAQETIASYAVYVTLTPTFRPGKRRRLEEVIASIKNADLDPEGKLSQDGFLLDKKWRWISVAVFCLVSAMSVVIPAVEW